MTTTRTWALALAGALVTAPGFTQAQDGPIVASPGVVVGAVTDASGAPLDADVTFGSSKNRVSTGPGGRFRFEAKAGKYTIAARRVGYFPRTTSVEVGDSGAVVMIALTALPNKLPPVITEAERGGLSGLVGDTLFGPLPNALIEVIGENRRATTDSAGEFYIPLGTGKYMVKVSRPNFTTRMVSVTVPVLSGRRMEVALIPASSRGLSNRDEAAARMLQQRLVRRNAAYSKLFTAEDIEKVGFKSLGQIASSGSVQYVDNSCPVMLPSLAENEAIDGMPRGSVPLWSLDAADLEFVEIYTAKPSRNTQKSIGRGAPRSTRAPPAPRCPQIIAWLKK